MREFHSGDRVIVKMPSKKGNGYSGGRVSRYAPPEADDVLVKADGVPFPLKYPKSRVRYDPAPDIEERWKIAGKQRPSKEPLTHGRQERGLMKAIAPLHRFRLYPEAPRGLYIVVNVWPSRKRMHEHLLRVRGLTRVSTTVANCQGLDVTAFPKGRPARKRPWFAEVNFTRRRIGTSIITHELLHATFAWARRLELTGGAIFTEEEGGHCDDVEERLCHVHGNLCRAFVARATYAGLYE